MFDDPEVVSGADDSSDEYPWDCGPCSAIRGSDITICAWTKRITEWDDPPIKFYDILSDMDL